MIKVGEIKTDILDYFMLGIESYYNDYEVIDLKILKQDIYYQAFIIYILR